MILTVHGKSGQFKLFYLEQNSLGEWVTHQKDFNVGVSA